MSRLLHRLSFRQRIWYSFVTLMTVAIAATGWISYTISSRVVEQNALQLRQDTINKSAQVLDEKLKKIVLSILSLKMSDAYQGILRDVSSNDSSRYYARLTALQPILAQLKFNDTFIQSIVLTTPIGDFYPTNYTRLSQYSFYESDMYKQIQASNRAIWVAGHEDRFFYGNEQVISLVLDGSGSSPLYDVYIVVNIKVKDLQNLIVSEISRSTGFSLIDERGNSVLGSASSVSGYIGSTSEFLAQFGADRQGNFISELNDDEYMVNYARLEMGKNWLLYDIQSKREVLKQVEAIKWTTLLLIIGSMILVFLTSNVITKLLLRPLGRLQKLMARVENNDLNARFHSEYRDEVSQVGMRFNFMLDEIKKLIKEVKDGEEEKRRTEIKALSAQMEPHFLYNTLNTIYCKSILGDNDDVNEMILALSSMFQLGLSQGRDIVRIEEELSHVRYYLMLQQQCYEGRFDFQIAVEDESILSYCIPKLMLQPLVENAILHGFRDIEEGGFILIELSRAGDGDMLRIVVEDNGIGMNSEGQRPLLPEPSMSHKGYALRNIRDRLRLYYGQAASVRFAGKPGQGCRVELMISMRKEEMTDGYTGSDDARVV
ncbi:cache domain-containing sensor histidine kinase [Paenibacillus wynnii]|uniref:cache domain-containing sensor histidine kinase n=1 Tax=Paenibacillus wynnii TaxID=268407 RepID=UPI0027931852|nr:sensor histidine kinase [Paenibacillus wynnii]MDQ0191749.1 two-component system sensor histidine kinase YesM [Paenibacillus wynnii]